MNGIFTMTQWGRNALWVLALCCAPMLTQAQDIHFAQFYHAPLTLSPALTGVYKGDMRFLGNFRSQWSAANAPFSTVNATYDQKFYPKKIRNPKGFFGGGLQLFHDRAGDGKLSFTQIALSGSYVYRLDQENFLSGGLQVGIANRAFNPSDLTFDNQYNGTQFEETLPTNEQFPDRNKIFPDFSLGLNWHGQQAAKRTKIDVGVGFYHLLQPDQSFFDQSKSPLHHRISLYMIPTLQVGRKFDIVAHGTAQLQDTYFEGLAGGGLRVHLNQIRTKELAIQLTGSYRFNSAFGDAIVPAAELHFKNWLIGVSYDINVSGFAVATNRNGGPELAIRYIITTVKPLNAFKICPII